MYTILGAHESCVKNFKAGMEVIEHHLEAAALDYAHGIAPEPSEQEETLTGGSFSAMAKVARHKGRYGSRTPGPRP